MPQSVHCDMLIRTRSASHDTGTARAQYKHGPTATAVIATLHLQGRAYHVLLPRFGGIRANRLFSH